MGLGKGSRIIEVATIRTSIRFASGIIWKAKVRPDLYRFFPNLEVHRRKKESKWFTADSNCAYITYIANNWNSYITYRHWNITVL